MLYFLILTLLSFTESFSYGKVAVIGTNGNLGRIVVNELCKKKISTKILNIKKKSSKLINFNNDYHNIKIINGDVNNFNSIVELLEGVDTCIAVHSSKRKTKLIDLFKKNRNDLVHSVNVNYIGIKNIINAAKITKTKHIICVTENDEKPWSIPSIIINVIGSMCKGWNYVDECELRNSNISYTIIRTGQMNYNIDYDMSLILEDNGKFLPVSKISYNNIAKLCVDCIMHPNVKNTTLVAMTTTPGYGKSSWIPLLKKIDIDRKRYPNKLLTILKHYIGVSILCGILISIISLIIKKIIYLPIIIYSKRIIL